MCNAYLNNDDNIGGSIIYYKLLWFHLYTSKTADKTAVAENSQINPIQIVLILGKFFCKDIVTSSERFFQIECL